MNATAPEARSRARRDDPAAPRLRDVPLAACGHIRRLGVRRAYERRLGHFIVAHPRALSCARELIAATRRYLVARAELTATSRPRRRLEVRSLMRRCGRPLADPFAGRVGLDTERLSRLFAGDGHVRELMAHVWSFACNLLCHDLIGVRRFSSWRQAAAVAGYDLAVIETSLAQAKRAYRRRTGDSSGRVGEPDAREDFLKMPWHPVRRAQRSTRLKGPQLDVTAAWSTMTRAEFEAVGGCFSPIERRLESGLGADFVPWLDASRVWSLDPSSRLVRWAHRAGVPLVTGLSGVTMQLLLIARALNVGPLVDVRLACLGYLLSTGAHSFHEVMAVAQAFGCPYRVPCDYLELAPLSRREIVRALGAEPPDRPGPRGSERGYVRSRRRQSGPGGLRRRSSSSS